MQIHLLPSVMATATVLHVFTSFQPSLGVEYQEELVAVLGIDKGKVEDCYRVITKIVACLNPTSESLVEECLAACLAAQLV